MLDSLLSAQITAGIVSLLINKWLDRRDSDN